MSGQGILLILQLTGSIWYTKRYFSSFVRNYISDIEVETQDNLLSIHKNREMRAETKCIIAENCCKS